MEFGTFDHCIQSGGFLWQMGEVSRFPEKSCVALDKTEAR